MPDETPYAPYAGPTLDAFAAQLKKETAAVRLQFSKFGVRRRLGLDQIARAAKIFSADSQLMSASKQILNSRDPAWVAVTSPIGKARLFWRTMTVPYPVKGIRLVRRELIPMFDQTLEAFASELHQAKQKLETAYVSLRLEAQQRLGQLFNHADYPESCTADFTLEWDYPSVEPPDYLKELNPALYEQERQRLENRFAEAAALAENAFAAELQELVSHLVERMTPEAADGTAPGATAGKKKRLNKKAVDSFREFFERFQSIRVGSNAQLDQLVSSARKLIDGASLDDMRGNDLVRQNMAQEMTALRSQLDTMLIDRPKRAYNLDEDET